MFELLCTVDGEHVMMGLLCMAIHMSVGLCPRQEIMSLKSLSHEKLTYQP